MWQWAAGTGDACSAGTCTASQFCNLENNITGWCEACPVESSCDAMGLPAGGVADCESHCGNTTGARHQGLKACEMCPTDCKELQATHQPLRASACVTASHHTHLPLDCGLCLTPGVVWVSLCTMCRRQWQPDLHRRLPQLCYSRCSIDERRCGELLPHCAVLSRRSLPVRLRGW